jgi:hypothetical protein
MIAIIGAHPSRAELIAMVGLLGWIPLGRNEKRVKAVLIRRLENLRSELLPLLDTPTGMATVRAAYQAVLNQRTPNNARSNESLPPEATVKYYLNRHDEETTEVDVN